MDTCLSEDQLKRYYAEDLGPAERERVGEHLRQCLRCAERDAALVQRREGLLEKMRGLHRAGDGEETLPSPPETFAAHIGIDGYDILRELQRGGQGVVYQAVQRSTRSKVAIKVLLEGPHASDSNRKRFEREIELVAQLKHPHIISILHSGAAADGRQFYVMDYVRGVPLTKYVSEEKLVLEKALELFCLVCDAVQHAHQRGIIHRDLKPSNILVDSVGRPKLLDFGLAKWLAAPMDTLPSISQALVGTLPYVSPEQTRGNPDLIDTRTDIYSLGVILYEMLTGQYPYPVQGDLWTVADHIRQTQPEPPMQCWSSDSGIARCGSRHLRPGQCPIDDELQTIVLKALAKEPERRYQSAGELARDLRHYLSGEPIEAKSDSGWYLMRVALRRHRGAARVAAAFLLVSVLFGSYAYAGYLEKSRVRRIEAMAFEADAALREGKLDLARDRIDVLRVLAREEAESREQTLSAKLIARAAQNAMRDGELDLARDRIRDLRVLAPEEAEGLEAVLLTRQADRLADTAMTAYGNNRYPKAIKAADEALGIDASCTKAIVAKTFSLYKTFLALSFANDDRDLLQGGLALCERGIELDEDKADLWNLKAFYLYTLGDLQAARVAEEEAIDLDDGKPLFRSQLAVILALDYRFDDALNASSVAADNTSRQNEHEADDNSLRTRATLLRHSGDEQAALALLGEALHISRKDERTYLQLAHLHLTSEENGDPERALYNARIAESLTGRKWAPRVLRVLAQAELANGLNEDALRHAQDALDGSDTPGYCRLILSIALARLGRTEQARTHLLDAVADPPPFRDGVVVDAVKGMLWFDTLTEFETLRREAEEALEN